MLALVAFVDVTAAAEAGTRPLGWILVQDSCGGGSCLEAAASAVAVVLEVLEAGSDLFVSAIVSGVLGEATTTRLGGEQGTL